MAYLGDQTAEEFAAGHPNHPFARPGIHFVPKRSGSRASSSPPTQPAPEETPPLPEEPPFRMPG